MMAEQQKKKSAGAYARRFSIKDIFKLLLPENSYFLQ